MKELTPSQAFNIAPPRRPAVLCVQGKDGMTGMMKTEWFSWLNMKNQPMLSFSIARDAGFDLREDDKLYLTFPPVEEAQTYRKGAYAPMENGKLPGGMQTRKVNALPVVIPAGAELVLCCTLAYAYNYPFGKVRIHNCNLDEALSLR